MLLSRIANNTGPNKISVGRTGVQMHSAIYLISLLYHTTSNIVNQDHKTCGSCDGVELLEDREGPLRGLFSICGMLVGIAAELSYLTGFTRSLRRLTVTWTFGSTGRAVVCAFGFCAEGWSTVSTLCLRGSFLLSYRVIRLARSPDFLRQTRKAGGPQPRGLDLAGLSNCLYDYTTSVKTFLPCFE